MECPALCSTLTLVARRLAGVCVVLSSELNSQWRVRLPALWREPSLSPHIELVASTPAKICHASAVFATNDNVM